MRAHTRAFAFSVLLAVASSAAGAQQTDQIPKELALALIPYGASDGGEIIVGQMPPDLATTFTLPPGGQVLGSFVSLSYMQVVMTLPGGLDSASAFARRSRSADLGAVSAAHVFGLSTQSNAYQTEMASRLHLPFAVLSDEKLTLTRALDLPTMQVAGLTMIKRMALIVDDARITHVFYPVFPPDQNAGDVLAWLKKNPV